MLAKVISDGRSGVGQAALRAARAAGIPTGGVASAGLGRIPVPTAVRRARANAAAADGTLVLLAWPADLAGNTLLALTAGVESGKPCVCVGLHDPEVQAATADWVRHYVRGGVLNVAGPRESRSPGVGAAAEAWLAELFRLLSHPARGGPPAADLAARCA